MLEFMVALRTIAVVFKPVITFRALVTVRFTFAMTFRAFMREFMPTLWTLFMMLMAMTIIHIFIKPPLIHNMFT